MAVDFSSPCSVSLAVPGPDGKQVSGLKMADWDFKIEPIVATEGALGIPELLDEHIL